MCLYFMHIYDAVCMCIAEFSSDGARAACATHSQVQRLHRSHRGRHVRPQDRQTLDETHTSRQGSNKAVACSEFSVGV